MKVIASRAGLSTRAIVAPDRVTRGKRTVYLYKLLNTAWREITVTDSQGLHMDSDRSSEAVDRAQYKGNHRRRRLIRSPARVV